MTQIVLNEKQKAVIQKHLDGTYSPFMSPMEDQLAMNEVIEMADDLLNELNAQEEWENEFGLDLMAWFWSKYQEQESK